MNIKLSLVSIVAILLAPSGFAIPIYYSTGKFGEPYYSQFPPSGKFTTLHFHLPKNNTQPASTDNTRQQQCQKLKDNLAALNTGGNIREIDQHGNSIELDDTQVKLRKSQTEQALLEHCQS